MDLAIVERATGETVGEVFLASLDAHNRSCGFRIALFGRQFFGRGLGTERAEHTVAVGSDGTVYGWGYNAEGQVGNGATSPAETAPVTVLDLHSYLTQVAAPVFGNFSYAG